MQLINLHKIKTTRLITATVTLSTMFVFSIVANNGEAFARDIDINNNLGVSLIFHEVENRQNVQIKSSPPDEVKAGETGTFKVGEGDQSSATPFHLKVQYYVGEKGSSDTVSFGFKTPSGDLATWDDVKCFTNTPDDIKGKYDHCNSGHEGYTFSPK